MKKAYPTILMYHGIIADQSSVPADRETGAGLYDVSAENFSTQMEFLKNHFYTVTVAEEADLINKSKLLITFDDGEKNNFQSAFPVLKRCVFPAYFFITVERIGKKGYMNWEELKELRDANMFIGSHGLTHRILTELKEKEVEKELAQSKLALEQNLKISVDYFSVPRGFYDARIIEMARRAGYKKIFTSAPGAPAEGFCLGRMAVKGDWNLKRFEQALSGEVPAGEDIFNFFKNAAKKVLGGRAYDNARTSILKRKQ